MLYESVMCHTISVGDLKSNLQYCKNWRHTRIHEISVYMQLASVSVASIDVASVRVYKNPASIQAD